MDIITIIIIAAVVALIIFRYLFYPVTVFESHRGLKYRKGRVVAVLGAGAYWLARSTKIELVDIRPRFITVAGQEVISTDGVTLKVSLAARYEIVDPEKAVIRADNLEEALYLTLQLALRKIVGSATIDELLEKRNEFGGRLAEDSASAVEELGLRLLRVDIKDIMLPGEVKRLFNQVVSARKEGLAALEVARGETAAMRSLANIAKVLEDHPSLLQLRALQRLGETTGNSLVIGLPAHPGPAGNKAGVDKQ